MIRSYSACKGYTMTQRSSDGTRSLKQTLLPTIRALIPKEQWPSPIRYLHRQNSYHCLNARETQIKAHSCRSEAFFGELEGRTWVAQWGPMGALCTQDLINSNPSGRGFFTPGLPQQRRCYVIKKIPQRKPLQTVCYIPRKTLPRGEDKRGKMNQTYRHHSLNFNIWMGSARYHDNKPRKIKRVEKSAAQNAKQIL